MYQAYFKITRRKNVKCILKCVKKKKSVKCILKCVKKKECQGLMFYDTDDSFMTISRIITIIETNNNSLSIVCLLLYPLISTSISVPIRPPISVPIYTCIDIFFHLYISAICGF